MTKEVSFFINQINSIFETDYGDFMRKANTYLNDLKIKLEWTSDPNIKKKLNQMKNYLQYNSTWNLESTQQQLIKDAHDIDDLMLGLKQGWESGDLMDNPTL